MTAVTVTRRTKREHAIGWLSPSFPQNRRTYWTRAEATAWIATRSQRAVQAVTEAPMLDGGRWRQLGLDPLLHVLTTWAAAREYEGDPSEKTIGTTLAESALDLDTAIRDGKIELKNGKLRSAEAKRLWPSEGQGRGRGWSGYAHFDPVKIESLVTRFLSEERRCTSLEDLRNDYDLQTNAEIDHALRLAIRRIKSGRRLYACSRVDGPLENGPNGLSPEQAKAALRNLKTWLRRKRRALGGKAPQQSRL